MKSEMKNDIEVSDQLVNCDNMKRLSLVLSVIGVIATVLGFKENAQRAWGNILVCNYYFLSLAIGASFFAAIQNITQSGWSAMFKRVPEAITAYLPYGSVLVLLMGAFGVHSLYHWSHEAAVQSDILLQHKAPYLNVTFFLIRLVVSLGLWFFLTSLLRKFSLREDVEGGLKNFIKGEFYSKVLIFILALTFSLFTFDLIMSIDSHWFSTIFAIKNFVSAFLHGSALILLMIFALNKRGYFPVLNAAHRHDLSKYLFMLAMIWGYMWFSQFFLMWYSNIPEETVYYAQRLRGEWKTIFFADLFLNWTFPFLFLLHNRVARNTNALIFTSALLLFGFWLDIYLQVFPGLTGNCIIGFVEVGIFSGFLGIFIFSVASALGKTSIIPKNHPYLGESMAHEVH